MFITISRFKLSEPFLSCDLSNKQKLAIYCLFKAKDYFITHLWAIPFNFSSYILSKFY